MSTSDSTGVSHGFTSAIQLTVIPVRMDISLPVYGLHRGYCGMHSFAARYPADLPCTAAEVLVELKGVLGDILGVEQEVDALLYLLLQKGTNMWTPAMQWLRGVRDLVVVNHLATHLTART
ncbi:hypothetical protein M9H77_31242 [Catharanthus roseus]|uniref:Uncharacterized protein n=1 Tax=Catharanthus roseus TaxID=4058 RepID=A0ACB9ZZH9_CATRO|nr:hypothetical protein M9H77_31242 [Catharanthus roseus]